MEKSIKDRVAELERTQLEILKAIKILNNYWIEEMGEEIIKAGTYQNEVFN